MPAYKTDQGQYIKQVNLFENRFPPPHPHPQSLQKRTHHSDHVDFYLVMNSTDAAARLQGTPDQQNCPLMKALLYIALSVVICHTA